MLNIKDKSRCCGCAACVQRCPKRCISLREDEEGFLYPEADKAVCIDCGLCEKVCPVINNKELPHLPMETLAAKNLDEDVRRASSSGGVFTLLAECVIGRGGVVFGARFDEKWEVAHGYAVTMEGVAVFRGSKYLQSRMGESYKQAERFLKQGREVLFCGTPCQIAGLRNFLRKDYDNLLLVDFICHGVPSPGVFRQYLEEEKRHFARKGGKFSFALSSKPSLAERDSLAGEEVRVEAVSFRDKRLGWKKYSFALSLSKATAAGEKNTVSLSKCFQEDPFMGAFLQNLILRPSCYACPAKGGRSGSDITLGDFWGIERVLPDFDDDRGASLVMAQTEKGREVLASLRMESRAVGYAEAVSCNPSAESSVAVPQDRARFFRVFKKGGFTRAFRYTQRRRLRGRLLHRLVMAVRRVFPKKSAA